MNYPMVVMSRGELPPDIHGHYGPELIAYILDQEERHYRKLIMTTDEARADLERVKGQIWTFYQTLKAYKANPAQQVIAAIEKQFDDIFQKKHPAQH